jgi:nitrous oxidase accessory protein NosD
MHDKQISGDGLHANRRQFLVGASAVTLAGLAGVPAATARRHRCDVLVDAGGGGDATTVQGGVDAASAGETVCIADGTYTEHVHVDKDLTLTNARGATPTIEIPANPPNYTIPESGNTWEVVLFVGPETGGAAVDVDISGLAIDGKGQQPNDARVASGLLLRNVQGSVEDVTVQDMAVGGKQTGGIAVYGESDVAVHDSTIDRYERFGIVANGDGGAHPAPTVDVRGNDVTGSGDGSETAWGPNGIQIGYGAGGSIRDNAVHRNRWSDSSQVGSGIIVFESDGVMVRGNTVTECDAALTCGTWAWFRPSATNNRFVRNEVEGAIVGVHLESIAWDGYSDADPDLTNTKIVNNALVQGGTGEDPSADSIGVELLSADGDPDYDPILDNTKVIRNEITGFATDVVDGGTDTKNHANAMEP